jgi:endoglucanase
MVLALLLGAAAILAPAQAATADPSTTAAGCQVAYEPGTFAGGFTAMITVTNTGDIAINGWTLSFPLDSGVEVVAVINANLEAATGLIITTNKPWNGQVAPGGSIGLRIFATGTNSGTPSPFTVNGIVCD